ncbi:McrB family protein [Fibrobacter sp.]
MPLTNNQIHEIFQRKGYEVYTPLFNPRNTYNIKVGRNAAHINAGVNLKNSSWALAAHIILTDNTADVIQEAQEYLVPELSEEFNAQRNETFIYQPTGNENQYQKYRIYKNEGQECQIELVGMPDLLDNLVPALNDTGVVDLDSINSFVQDETNKRYVSSLLAKPFVILTGNSGTGKTRIAVKLANFFKAYLPNYNKDLRGLFQYVLNNDIEMNGTRLASVSDTAVEVYNTNGKKICISFGIIQEYVNWYNINGMDTDPERSVMQDNGSFDRQSYSWDRPQILSIAKYVCDYQQRHVNDIREENCLLVPVGADWTDNTKILGYYNPLANKGKGKYEKTKVFEFIELAVANPTIPFFLILDEMNLSHVERYFSDFLSKMELQDYKHAEEKVFFDIPGYGPLELPKNLFVTGTVNIDETTYMFSPKVLDRANVIEFKPTKESVFANFQGPAIANEDEIAMGSASDFMQLANTIRSKDPSPEETVILRGVADILDEFYTALEKNGFEFAFRTVKEISLYTIAACEIATDNMPTASAIADVQILQKILPKIHGNKRQIGGLLTALHDLCEAKGLELSKAKIEQMIARLGQFQHVSFI